MTFEGTSNDTFIFTFQTEGSNYSRVWRSDGTENGTFPITDEVDGNGSNGSTISPSEYVQYNNKLYFVTREYLYTTDGTLENTKIVSDLAHDTSANSVRFGDVIV
ncbi:MAG TPA: hypothetical protein DEG69_04205, partial [Flavobacteriaceae bacterium]|nr:hypothetical protein [Flavobacteriaceae bacterium]